MERDLVSKNVHYALFDNEDNCHVYFKGEVFNNSTDTYFPLKEADLNFIAKTNIPFIRLNGESIDSSPKISILFDRGPWTKNSYIPLNAGLSCFHQLGNEVRNVSITKLHPLMFQKTLMSFYHELGVFDKRYSPLVAVETSSKHNAHNLHDLLVKHGIRSSETVQRIYERILLAAEAQNSKVILYSAKNQDTVLSSSALLIDKEKLMAFKSVLAIVEFEILVQDANSSSEVSVIRNILSHLKDRIRYEENQSEMFDQALNPEIFVGIDLYTKIERIFEVGKLKG